jgi:hypothetical protein
MAAPLKITLYNPVTNEEQKTFERSFIPWKIMKKAVRLLKTMGNSDASKPDELPDELYDELAGLVAEIFGNQFTVGELDDGADVGEMIAVLLAIQTRVSSLPNPTPPGR